MSQYRIKEFNGRFDIEVKAWVDTGSWLRTKIEAKWFECYRNGQPIMPRKRHEFSLAGLYLHSFSTLDEAKEQVAKFKKGVICHEV